MEKMIKIKDRIVCIYSKMHSRIHSHNFRKMVLLALIAITFLFNLSVLSFGKKIERTIDQFDIKEVASNPWEKNVRFLVDGSPMERMIPFISRKDKITAAFLVSIAKKESNWGEYSPRQDGKNCYNYWGYRGYRGNITQSGYTCFSSPQQAVNTVSRRINDIISKSKVDTPAKMVVWKCGHDCSWDNPESVKKWVSDVDYYFQKFYE